MHTMPEENIVQEITRRVLAELADKRGHKILLKDYVHMTGSIKQTARVLGVPYASMIRWMNGQKPSKSYLRLLESRGVSWCPPQKEPPL